MQKTISFMTLVLATLISQSICGAQEVKPEELWDLNALASAPVMRWIDRESPIHSLIYEGASFQNKPTEVFAFYATPGSISGDPSKDVNLPAVVLIHGGGGTAFADWVWLWAKRGYAAIAMDLSGSQPEAPVFRNGSLVSNLRVKRKRLEHPGPNQSHAEKFDCVGGSIDDDWPFHAVSNVIRAHSLIRSFEEVDPARTAVTGISWGGYTTCIVASVDTRFKAAVPVYGCGFLHEGESVQKSSIDRLGADKRRRWIEMYDPSSHLQRCRVPILFVNGTNDKHYPLNSYSKSYTLVPGERQIRIEVSMGHSHRSGWAPQEIGLFIDQHLRGSEPLPNPSDLILKGTTLSTTCSCDNLVSAAFHFTTDAGPLVSRKWHTIDAQIADGNRIQAPLPDGATIVLASFTDRRGAMVSTNVLFPE